MSAPLPPRERILATASRLFYVQGVRATGIDQIIAEASVAKATFYYHYPSKNKLVRAYLARRHAYWMDEFNARLAKVRTRGFVALADALGGWFRSGQFNGCAFINITAESMESEWRMVSCKHKDTLQQLIEKLVPRDLPPKVRRETADRVLLVMEGMIVRYQMTRDSAVVKDGRALLLLLQRTAGSKSKKDKAAPS